MDTNLKNKLKSLKLTGDNESAFEQLVAVLDLPDATFDRNYEKLKGGITKMYSNKAIQDQIINIVSSADVDIDAELAARDKVIKEIESTTLSTNKKDLIITILKSATDVMASMTKNPRIRIEVKVKKLNSDAILPTYAHPSDAGADIYSSEDVEIPGGATTIVKTGIQVAIPAGYMIQICPRSGLSAKTPLRIANAPGTIDSSYRGEIGVIMHNTGAAPYTVNKGDRIAQMIIAPAPMIVWEEVNELDETERGNGGFGSTGKS